jgi:hypothetical protein
VVGVAGTRGTIARQLEYTALKIAREMLLARRTASADLRWAMRWAMLWRGGDLVLL